MDTQSKKASMLFLSKEASDRDKTEIDGLHE